MFLKVAYLKMFSIISKTKAKRCFESYPKERIFDVTENDEMWLLLWLVGGMCVGSVCVDAGCCYGVCVSRARVGLWVS
jgi:hypothetical protein